MYKKGRVVHQIRVVVCAFVFAGSGAVAVAAEPELGSGPDLGAKSVTTQLAATLLLNDVYQPFHARFVQSTHRWMESTVQTCVEPTTAGVERLQEEFGQLVMDFATIELYRVGPMLKENRQNRLFYWPDTRRVGEQQLSTLLAQGDIDQVDIKSLSGKSVALQGLPVTERLLFSQDYAAQLADPVTVAPCHVLQLAAANMYVMAEQLNAGWQADTDFVQSFINPGQESAFFRNEDEVLRSIVTQIAVGLDGVLDRKLLPIVDAKPTDIRKGPLWLSQQTLGIIEGNLMAIRALLTESQLAEKTGLAHELEFEFRTVSDMLEKLKALPTLVGEAHQLTDDAYLLLKGLSAVVSGIKFTVGDRFSAGLGVSAGFNSDDGD